MICVFAAASWPISWDRPLGTAGDDRVGHAFDPDACPTAAAAIVSGQRLERVDLVGAGVLPEPRKTIRFAPFAMPRL